MKKPLAALAMVVPLAAPAFAASVEVAPFGEQAGKTVYALALAGEIKPGDDLRVASMLGQALVEHRFPGFMVLSSNGGSTDASLGIARIAHEYGMPVLVRSNCLSGCAIIALSAWRGRLFVVESGAIGLHQAWTGEWQSAVPNMQTTRRVASVLKQYGVPASVLDRMLHTAPHDMTYLSNAELKKIGALVKRDPSLP